MIIQDIINYIEKTIPTTYAEDFDNVGLLVGDKSKTVTNVLVTLDCLETVIDEAIKKDCNFIISFHPIIFKGLKKITGKNYVERVVIKAIKNDIAIYATHTAYDNHITGVNAIICNQLNLINQKILIPQKNTIKKLTTYTPNAEAEKIRSSLFNAGAGAIGNYDNCSFNVDGLGTFKGTTNSNPTKGEKGTLHYENETKITVIYSKHVEQQILKALHDNHSYEEVAYEVLPLENTNQHIGIGMIGELPQSMTEANFLSYLKDKMKTSTIRHSKLLDKPIKKVAVLGGSGSFAIPAAKAQGADVLVTSDLKYHDFFSAEQHLILADIGHYESEQFTKNALVAHLTKKFTSFAVLLSNTYTNPVKYF